MPILLIALYPVLVHVSLLVGAPTLQVLAILSFACGVLWSGLRRKSRSAWLALMAIGFGVLLISFLDITLYLLYAPPIIVPLVLLLVFGRTLLPGREPLVTAIGEASRGPLSDTMRHYTRRVTQLWCLVFAAMLLWSVILPWLNQPLLWSWFTNLINYGLVTGLFVGEFLVRKKRFPEHDHPGFLEYLRIVASANTRPGSAS